MAELPFPTALVHLLGVELLPVFGFCCASWSAGKHFVAHELMATRFVGVELAASPASEQVDSHVGVPPTLQAHVDCINHAVVEFMTTEDINSAFECPGCGAGLTCPESVAPVALPVMVLGALALAGLLLLWVLGAFFQRGLCLRRAGSGAYLRYTFELEKQVPYRALIYIMLSATALTMAIMLITVWTSTSGSSFNSLMEMVGMDALTLIICLWKLLVPKTGVHHWMDFHALSSCTFTRTWLRVPRFLPEGNDVFASKLVDAMWQAKNGQKKLLRQMLDDPADVDRLVEMFSRMPTEEQEMQVHG